MATTLVLRAYKNTFRVYANAPAREILNIEKTGAPFESVAHLASGKRGQTMLFEAGDVQNGGLLTLGLSAGLIHDVPTVKELMDRIMLQAREAIEKYN
jgi:nitronate monooxygenase